MICRSTGRTLVVAGARRGEQVACGDAAALQPGNGTSGDGRSLCTSSRQARFAASRVAWLDAARRRLTGRLMVAYDTKFVARCFYYDPTDPTNKIYTKVERIWWAVRWAQFPRP